VQPLSPPSPEHTAILDKHRVVAKFLDTRQKGQWDMEAHNAIVEIMVAERATTGAYVDPVSGRPFPQGRVMKQNPNRAERRLLEHWRRTGRT